HTPAVPDVFNALAKLTSAGFRIHVVSKCEETIQGKSKKWLARHDFYNITGIRPEDVHFYLARPETAGTCTPIRATHFVDDRLEVLSYLQNVPNLYLLNAIEEEVRQFNHAINKVVRVHSWNQLVPLLNATLQ